EQGEPRPAVDRLHKASQRARPFSGSGTPRVPSKARETGPRDGNRQGLSSRTSPMILSRPGGTSTASQEVADERRSAASRNRAPSGGKRVSEEPARQSSHAQGERQGRRLRLRIGTLPGHALQGTVGQAPRHGQRHPRVHQGARGRAEDPRKAGVLITAVVALALSDARSREWPRVAPDI